MDEHGHPGYDRPIPKEPRFKKYYNVGIADNGYKPVNLVMSEDDLPGHVAKTASQFISGTLDGPVTITIEERNNE